MGQVDPAPAWRLPVEGTCHVGGSHHPSGSGESRHRTEITTPQSALTAASPRRQEGRTIEAGLPPSRPGLGLGEGHPGSVPGADKLAATPGTARRSPGLSLKATSPLPLARRQPGGRGLSRRAGSGPSGHAGGTVTPPLALEGFGGLGDRFGPRRPRDRPSRPGQPRRRHSPEPSDWADPLAQRASSVIDNH